ncbi:MAG: hypothetical protein RLZZ373_490, partial [Pseudomonadota bacterium]
MNPSSSRRTARVAFSGAIHTA